jgi:methylmalonic aciduria homocystinuria type C protein
LPSFGRENARAIVIGNTRGLWEHVQVGTDAYVERAVRAAFPAAEHRWAHQVPATIAIQRAAVIAGLAWLSPSHLCVHPEYGPWIALRAVVVLDEPAPPARPRVPPPCDCARGCGEAYARAIAAGVPRSTAELRGGASRRGHRDEGVGSAEREPATWRLWLAVRDACPVGRAWRYADDQIAYHYAGEIPPLRRGSGVR